MDEVRDHVFDGIEEYDNPLPRWWLFLFYFTIAFAIGYAFVYPTTWFTGGTAGWTQVAQYEAQMAEAAKMWPQQATGKVDLTAYLQDPQKLSAGQKVFTTRCVVCHGANGEGKIGPSLRDAVWKYGGDPTTVVETITKGRPGGMPPWGKILSAEDIKTVASYVLSLSGGGSKQASSGAGARG